VGPPSPRRPSRGRRPGNPRPAAQGDPNPFGVARVLEVLLRDQYPGVELEVVNAAATAINSHYVYAAARGALRLEPDVFVVYAGNNEVVGPYGAGTVLTASAPLGSCGRPWPCSARGWARSSPTSCRARGRPAAAARPGAWHGMEMFLERQVRRGDPALERTYQNYERNLVDTVRLAQAAGVPVVLSTVAVNLRSCGPLASLHSPTLSAADRARWNELGAQAAGLERESRWAEAAQALSEALKLDPEHAAVAYRLGRAEAQLEQDATRGLTLLSPAISIPCASAPTPARTRSCATWRVASGACASRMPRRRWRARRLTECRRKDSSTTCT
jgi:hypothetical protein